MMGKLGRPDWMQRAREKQLARIADEADLASGRRLAKAVARTNSMFGPLDPWVLKNARIIHPETD